MILEGNALREPKTAAKALQQAWRYDPADSTATDLLSYDDGPAQVLQANRNPILSEETSDIFELLDAVLPPSGSTPIGHGSAERLGPGMIRSVAVESAGS